MAGETSGGPRTLIVGGGIAGLTAATALHRRGIPVEVAERTPEFGIIGSGITIQANASAVLDALDIPLPAEDVVPIGEFHMLDPKGHSLMSGNAARIMPEPPSFNVHRADLHRLLLAAAEGVPLRPGRAVTAITPGPDGVEVEFDDGERGRWDLVVGADGARSAVRRSLLGEAGAALRYSGQTCWRFAIEAPDLVPTVTLEQWTPGKRAGAVPLARGRIYVYLVESAPEGTPGPGTNHPDIVREKFSGQHPLLDPILERLGPETPIHHGDLCEHAAVHFGAGRVLLIGDAAHAMTPNLGQGAGTAIEDAGALALLMPQHLTDLDGLAPALDARRRKRVETITRLAWRIGRMAHWTNPVAVFLRNALLHRVPDSTTDAQTREMWRPGLELAAELRDAATPAA